MPSELLCCLLRERVQTLVRKAERLQTLADRHLSTIVIRDNHIHALQGELNAITLKHEVLVLKYEPENWLQPTYITNWHSDESSDDCNLETFGASST